MSLIIDWTFQMIEKKNNPDYFWDSGYDSE